jgi:GNAT superfamily N-acetyltransferase
MIQVKPLTIKDWEPFHQSLLSVPHKEFDTLSSERFEDLLFDERDYLASIWNKEGVMVGMMQYNETKRSGREQHLRSTSLDLILIHPAHRQKGYGKATLAWLIGYSKTRYLTCYPVSREGKLLVQSVGFVYNDDVSPSYDIRVLDKEAMDVAV